MEKDLLTLILEDPKHIKQNVKLKIEEAKEISKKINDEATYFGTYFKKNPTTEFQTNFRWAGFIDKNIRIGFGVNYDRKVKKIYDKYYLTNTFTDNGAYYYIDDDSYIYYFANYIKDKKPKSFEEFVKYVGWFLADYLSTDKYEEYKDTADRENMYNYIIDETGEKYYKPIKEHSIKDFAGRGISRCMEYTVLAQNILSVFGYETYAILGKIESEYQEGFHAFNCIDFDEINTIVDFSFWTERKDINNNTIPGIPFMVDIDEDECNRFQNKETLTFDEQLILYINGKDIYIDKDEYRKYTPYKCSFYDELDTSHVKVKYI